MKYLYRFIKWVKSFFRTATNEANNTLDAVEVNFNPGESLYSLNLNNGHILNANAQLLRVEGKWCVVPLPRTLYVVAKNEKNALHKFNEMAKASSQTPS